MKEGDIVLTPLPQVDGKIKQRPVLLLRKFPPYGDFLVCGISSQLHQAVPDLDDIIRTSDVDFVQSGIRVDSVIRLAFLAVLPQRRLLGSIGAIHPHRHVRLLKRLGCFLVADLAEPSPS